MDIIEEFLKKSDFISNYEIHDDHEFTITIPYNWAKTVVDDPHEDYEALTEIILIELYIENILRDDFNINSYYCHVDYIY